MKRLETRKPFTLIRDAQKLCADLARACADADRRYRLTLCQDARLYSLDAAHALRFANGLPIGDIRRAEKQREAAELIEKVLDVLPALRMCRCMSPEREAAIGLSAAELRATCCGWIASDMRRIREHAEKGLSEMREKNRRRTPSCSPRRSSSSATTAAAATTGSCSAGKQAGAMRAPAAGEAGAPAPGMPRKTA